MATPSTSRAASPTPSQLPPVPPSPGYSVASTTNPMSTFSLPLPPPPRPAHTVLTRGDLERSEEAYAGLVAAAKEYRLALAALSSAASAFGGALEACARLKEARAEPIGRPAGGGGASGGLGGGMTASFTNKGAQPCTADTLMSASGVQHLVANHQQILSETVYRSFEVPLLDDLDRWRGEVEDERVQYEARARAQSREIKKLEKEGLRLHRQQRSRDVGRFRAHLVDLTHKLDGLTALHADHSRTLLHESQAASGRIVDASCSLVRAEMDIFESLARKGWSGGGLDDMLDRGRDLFAAPDDLALPDEYPVAGPSSTSSSKLFSILPPRSILADSAPREGGGGNNGGHTRADSLGVDDDGGYQPLTAVAESHAAAGDADAVMSAAFTKPRNARPFSPQPIRRKHMDVTIDSLAALTSDAGAGAGAGAEAKDADETTERDETQRDETQRETHHEIGDDSAVWSAPDSPRGRASPELVTDESSPDSHH